MISRLTAMVIASRGDDIQTSAGGPDPTTGKYVGWITLGPEDRYRPLHMTEPIYDSDEEAETAMKNLIREIREHEANL